MRKKSSLLVRPQTSLLLRFCVQELRQDTRNAAFCMFTNEAGERFFRIVTPKEFGDFNGFSRFVQCCSLWSNLDSSHHIAPDDGQESSSVPHPHRAHRQRYPVRRPAEGFDERFEEGGCSPRVSLFHEFDNGESRGPVDGHEQIELAFGGPHLGQVDVKEADRLGIEFLPFGRIACDIRQAADAVTLQTTMKGRAGELRDRSLHRIEL